jgi:hypothetical protein
MQVPKLLVVFALLLAIILPVGGCSSESDDKTPKVEGPIDPSIKPAGRGLGGTPGGPAAKPSGAGAGSQGAITKD